MSGADNGQQAAGDKWGDDIPPERQAELEALFQRQAAWIAKPEAERGESAFKGVRLTGADVFWLAARTVAGTIEAHSVAEQMVQLRRPRKDDALKYLLRLDGLHLEGGFLAEAHLEQAFLYRAHLEQTLLYRAHLEQAFLAEAHLERAGPGEAHLEGANLSRAHLESALLHQAHLEGANLSWAHLQQAFLAETHLKGAVLHDAHLEGANLHEAHLEGVNLVAATLDKTSHLNGAVLTGTSLDQVTFDNVNLTVVDWSLVPILGDEVNARRARDDHGKPKDAATRRNEFSAAVRANRLLAVTLRAQGLNEDADRYAYRAQMLQRQVLRRTRQYGRAFGSWLLDVVAGYGYNPMRSLIAYVLIICLFAGAYLLNAQVAAPHLTWDEALVLSISSFHGRGFFTSGISLGDTLARLAAGEAIIGLLIEITFIATFTQRFFAR